MGQAASAALHSSDMLGLHLPSLPVLNWPFLIFSANSIPLMVTTAFSNRLNPSIGRIRCLTRRWSCSMRLFQVLAGSDSHSLGKIARFLHFPHCAMRCRIGVQSDLCRCARVLHRTAEKSLCCVHIAIAGQEEIDGPAGFVHGPIQVDP